MSQEELEAVIQQETRFKAMKILRPVRLKPATNVEVTGKTAESKKMVASPIQIAD